MYLVFITLRALPVVTKPLSSKASFLANRQVTATPYCSLHPPSAALANVPKLSHTSMYLVFRTLRAPPVVTKPLSSKASFLANRQVTATPYCSLHPPSAALANVPKLSHTSIYLIFRTLRAILSNTSTGYGEIRTPLLYHGCFTLSSIFSA